MENNILSAEEFSKNFTTGKEAETTQEYISSMLIAFAQTHVIAALQSASEEAELETYGNFGNTINRYSILNAYPLTNIK